MNSKIKNAFDSVKFSCDLEEKAVEILSSELPREIISVSKKKVKKALLTAAIIVVMTAAMIAGGVAIKYGGFTRLTEIARDNADNFDFDAEVERVLRTAKFPDGADVGIAEKVGDVSITLDTVWIYSQEAPEYTLRCEFTYEGNDDVNPSAEEFCLYADGKEMKRNDSYYGYIGEYVDKSDKRCLSMRFLFADTIDVGTKLSFKGDIHTYDGEGNVTGTLGEFDMTFEITEKMKEDYLYRRAEEAALSEKDFAEIGAERVELYTAPWQYIGYERDGTAITEISYSNGYLSIAGVGSSPELYVNGREVRYPKDVIYVSSKGENLFANKWEISKGELTNGSLIGVKYYNNETESYTMLYLRYNSITGRFSAPKDENDYIKMKDEMDRQINERTDRGNHCWFLFYNEDVEGMNVSFTHLLIDKNGNAILVFKVKGHHSLTSLYYSAPVIKINGREYEVVNERKDYSHGWQEDGKFKCGDWMFTIEDLDLDVSEKNELSIEWDVYDTDFNLNLNCVGHISAVVEMLPEYEREFISYGFGGANGIFLDLVK